MNKKIVFLPLDERPCNYYYPQFLMDDCKAVELVTPSREIMGDKKIPANFEKIKEFILNKTQDAYGLILSIDLLLYGGIVPSRLHQLHFSELIKRIDIIKAIKHNNPSIKIYAFSLLMRCPQYSSSDEEPDYYGDCGKEIYKRGEIEHKIRLNIDTDEEKEKLNEYIKKTDYCIDDFLSRRSINTDCTIEILKMVNKEIDFLVIPQDDSSLYGYIKNDQEKVYQYIEKYNLSNDVLIYPGADEVGLVLLSRMLNTLKNKKPNIFVEYSSECGPDIVPIYEDRRADLTVDAQIAASNGIRVKSIDEANCVLMINSCIPSMERPNMTKTTFNYSNNRDINQFLSHMQEYLKTKKVVVADCSTINKGEISFFKQLEQTNKLYETCGYSGWNTFANTLGTAISQLTYGFHFGITEALKRFNALRVYEDLGYQAVVRQKLIDNYLSNIGLSYLTTKERRGVVSQKVEEELNKIIKELSPSTFNNYYIKDCYMPWIRMFEVGLVVEKRK